MARIPDAEIERLKEETSLERLVEARGVKLKRHGEDLVGLCPFHEDREPSLVVSPKKNLWHCLGACQTGGSVIDWVMKAQGVSFRHAAELLRAEVPLATSSSAPAKIVKGSSVKKLPKLFERGADDKALLRRVVDYYHRTLKESPDALAYLASRGLTHPEMIDRFRIGFANRTLGYRVPDRNRKEGAELRARLDALGLLGPSGHEFFAGSIVIPLFDEEGEVVQMYGRKITPRLRAGTPEHLYLPGPHRGVWNVEALEASREIVLCESLIDALTFWCAGFRRVTTSYGVGGFGPDHWAAFRKYGVRVVRIAYDRDAAGDRAAEKLSAALAAEGITSYRVVFPRGMDANEYANKVQPAARCLDIVLRQAQWMANGKGESAPAATPAPEGVPAIAASVATDDAGDVSGTAPVATADARDDAAAEREQDVSATNTPPLAASPKEPTTLPMAEAAETSPAPTTVLEESGIAGGDDELAAAEPESAAGAAAPAANDELVYAFGERRWRIRGLAKNLPLEQLRVNVLVSRAGDGGPGAVFVDTVELYSARQRVAFLKQAAAELGVEERVLRSELGEVLLRLEAVQERRIEEALAPKSKTPAMSEAERREALELLRDPKLLDRILHDFERSGVVGEETNKLVGYLAATSRKLEEPLAIVIQSSSAAGKSSLMEAILALMPEEERVQYSAMTGQSLFYMGEADLKHKILGIVEEEGAERASYALKLLQSEGSLTIASTGKDPATGKLVTHDYRVEGPVMIFLTTTAIEIDEELLNRCLVLTVDEGREQTRAIHELQRRSQTIEGLLLRQERDRTRRVHRNAQRILRPLLVANPFAGELTFADTRTRTRRDHMKYLTLIRSIALLHQYQRPLKTVEHQGEEVRYIEVTRDDIATANRLAASVLGRSLDELPPQTRRLLGLVEALVRDRAKIEGLEPHNVRFTRRDVRERTGWGNTQLKVHLGRLEELEYLVAERGGGRAVRSIYALSVGEDGAPLLPSVLEPSAATAGAHGYDENRPGFGGNRSGSEGAWSDTGRPSVRPRNANDVAPVGKLAGLRRNALNGRAVAVVATEGRAARSV
jgi:DNA primase catalytic core